MLGLDTMGSNLTSENIKIKIDEIIQSIPVYHRPSVYLEIMVHPGYKQENDFEKYPTCVFSKS
jgi:hypothetical protein